MGSQNLRKEAHKLGSSKQSAWLSVHPLRLATRHFEVNDHVLCRLGCNLWGSSKIRRGASRCWTMSAASFIPAVFVSSLALQVLVQHQTLQYFKTSFKYLMVVVFNSVRGSCPLPQGASDSTRNVRPILLPLPCSLMLANGSALGICIC